MNLQYLVYQPIAIWLQFGGIRRCLVLIMIPLAVCAYICKADEIVGKHDRIWCDFKTTNLDVRPRPIRTSLYP